MKKHLIAIIILSLVGSPSMIGAATIDCVEIDYGQERQIALPSAYDGRAYTSSVKNQLSEGNCWNYMSNGLLETSLMKQYGIIDKTFYNFSEEAMDRATSAEYGGADGFSRGYKNEGNIDIAIAYWTRKNGGPINEIMDVRAPYYVKHIVGIESEENDIQQIKEWIYQYGAVTASYYYGAYSEMPNLYSHNPYGSQQELAYYFPGNRGVNHGSIIVGWNDDYNKENFNATCRPSQNGAFLVKNSWGTNWGQNGYFWMSYETALSDVYAIAEVGNNDFYHNIYEYDPHGMVGFMSVNYNTNQGVYMNQYTTESEKESLTAIATYITNANNQYKIYVSTDGQVEHLKEVQVTNAGTYQTGKGYQMPYKGYMTFELSQPLTVSGNFLVAIEVTSLEKGTTNIPIEMNNEGVCNNVVIGSNRGYIAEHINALKADVKYDVANKDANLCLKAFTKTLES